MALAQTFRMLGQQMHLIADLAVPAHTRNDPHCPLPEKFEAWASAFENQFLIQQLIDGGPIRPDPAIFGIGVPVPDPIATVPVARLWDTDQYDGSNPAVTLGATIGLAEYTNANFFSDDTIFSAEIPFPAPTSVALRSQPEEAPGTGGQQRRYFQKVADGELIGHLAVPGALYDFLPDALKDTNIGLDPRVFTDYAAKLLPRAVGYSASLLDSFFRGRLGGSLDLQPDGGGIRATIRVVNASDEPMTGVVEVYGETEDGTRRPVGSGSVSLAPGADAAVVISPVPLDAPPPPWLVVFKGTLGDEADAVAAGTVGGGLLLVGLNRGHAPGSECSGPGGDFDGAIVVPGLALPMFLVPFTVDGAYVAHDTAFYDCIHFGGLVVEPAESRFQQLLYRSPSETPGIRLTVQSGGFLTAGCGLLELNGDFVEGTASPVTVELVEWVAPARLADFYGFTIGSPPAVRGVLGTLVAGPTGPSEPTTTVFDIDAARFFAFRLVDEPPAAILGPAFVPYDTPGATRSGAAPGRCLALLYVSLEP